MNRLRYAPSPTGFLHIGGARTALFNYLLAKQLGGKFVVRFEDTDQNRNVEGGVEDQLNGLKWLGINWDESIDIEGFYGPYKQSERLSDYKATVNSLLASKNAYECKCEGKNKDLFDFEIQQHSCDCSNLSEDEISNFKNDGIKFSIRFKVPKDKIYSIDDLIRGLVEFDSNLIGDFVIMRPDGMPTYNLAATVDDFLMKISLVVRGEEHLTNTPKQIMISDALGFDNIKYAHLPLILNPDRKKMSKRDTSLIQFIDMYKELGYLPEAVINFIALLGWSPGGTQEIFTKEELISKFSLNKVSKAPAVFDMAKLNHINHEYIKKADFANIVDMCIKRLQKINYLSNNFSVDWVSILVQLYMGQLTHLAKIDEFAALFFEDQMIFEEGAIASLNFNNARIVLDSFLNILQQSTEFSPETIKDMIKQVQIVTDIKGKDLFTPIRVASTGQEHGRDLDKMIYLLGKEKCILRLQKFNIL